MTMSMILLALTHLQQIVMTTMEIKTASIHNIQCNYFTSTIYLPRAISGNRPKTSELNLYELYTSLKQCTNVLYRHLLNNWVFPNIILKEDEKLISDQNIVSEKMNDFYVNIAQKIGINNTLKVKDEHPRIKKIKEHNLNKNFEFSAITEKQVSTCIKKTSSQKSNRS